jgi:ABC-type lipoprotein export system ATPase subunit
LSIKKVATSASKDTWFDVELPVNMDLVAIIGNKGSGKSALSDAIALAGATRNYKAFSFLNPARFRDPKTRLADDYVVTLRWADGNTTDSLLSRDPAAGSVERVKYLPQRYLEELCNDLQEGQSAAFDTELRHIIYSHVAEDDKRGLASMDELIKYRVNEIDQKRAALRTQLTSINEAIAYCEERLEPSYRVGLEKRLAAKRDEFVALEASRPVEVVDPSQSMQAKEESQEASEQIAKCESELYQVAEEEASLKELRSRAVSDQELGRRVELLLMNQREQCEHFVASLQALLNGMSKAPFAKDLFQVSINAAPVQTLARDATAAMLRIDAALMGNDAGSVLTRRNAVAKKIDDAKLRLSERERQFIQYKEELDKWSQARRAIEGSADRPGTIMALAGELLELEKLPDELRCLHVDRQAIARQIHAQLAAMAEQYERIYRPVQDFVLSAEQIELQVPLKFKVQVEESGFRDEFFSFINRQSAGTFQGIRPGAEVLQAILQESSFDSADGAIAFADRIDDALHFDRRVDGSTRAVQPARQLRGDGKVAALMDFVFGFDYLMPRYSLTYDDQDISKLSPGERGLLLLLFYLLVDTDDMPLIIDQPEENLDNQTIYKVLVRCIKHAKQKRQVVMVTHNPNLAVVCDAEQIIHARRIRGEARFSYAAGAIESPSIRDKVVEILEGTVPAFKNRQSKYKLR